MIIEKYRDRGWEFRWRMKADNGRIIAVSSEGYRTQRDMEFALILVLEKGRSAKIKNLQGVKP